MSKKFGMRAVSNKNVWTTEDTGTHAYQKPTNNDIKASSQPDITYWKGPLITRTDVVRTIQTLKSGRAVAE